PRPGLARQHAAEAPAELRGRAEDVLRALDLALAQRRLAVREIRRVAHHRYSQPASLGLRPDLLQVGAVERVEEPRVELDAVERELSRELDPAEDAHLPRDDRVEEALGERGEAGTGHTSTGLRPARKRSSRPTTSFR